MHSPGAKILVLLSVMAVFAMADVVPSKESGSRICKDLLGKFHKPQYVCAGEHSYIFCVPNGKDIIQPCAPGTKCDCKDDKCRGNNPCATREKKGDDRDNDRDDKNGDRDDRKDDRDDRDDKNGDRDDRKDDRDDRDDKNGDRDDRNNDRGDRDDRDGDRDDRKDDRDDKNGDRDDKDNDRDGKTSESSHGSSGKTGRGSSGGPGRGSSGKTSESSHGSSGKTSGGAHKSPFEICEENLGRGFSKPKYVCVGESHFIFCDPKAAGKNKILACAKGTECEFKGRNFGDSNPCAHFAEKSDDRKERVE